MPQSSVRGILQNVFRWHPVQPDGGMAGQRSRHVQASIAAALVGLALSVAAWAIVWHRENQLAELELRERADDFALLLQYGIDEELKTLVGLRALLQSSDRVIGRREFVTFAGLLLPNLPAIQNLIWIPRVLRADRDALEAEAARDGIPDYHIKSVTAGGLVRAEERDEYFPILYSTTARTTAPIFGLDLGSEPMRRAILERARDSGRPAASPVTRLAGDMASGTPSLSCCRSTRPVSPANPSTSAAAI